MEVINLNLIPNGTNPVVHVSQYDEGRDFRFNLFDGTSVLTLDGTETIECDVKKPDGNIVTVAVPNTSDSYIVVTTTLQMTACGGNSLGTIKISKGGVNLYTLNFVLYCERSPLENGIESESSIHNLEEQIAEAVADQYDADSVVFDNTPTQGHGIGFAVTSEGVKNAIDGIVIPDELNDLSDVDISGQAIGEALVWDGTKWVNGTVSTVGNLDDLNDVDTSGKASGDSLRYDGDEWIAKPTTIKMTQAEYNAIVDFTPYANTHIVITDAPNLNPTASDIEYSGGVTVKQAIDSINSGYDTDTFSVTSANANVTVVYNKSHYITPKVVHILLMGKTTANLNNTPVFTLGSETISNGVTFPIFSSPTQWDNPDLINYGYLGSTQITATVGTTKPFFTVDLIIVLKQT